MRELLVTDTFQMADMLRIFANYIANTGVYPEAITLTPEQWVRLDSIFYPGLNGNGFRGAKIFIKRKEPNDE